MRKFLEGGAREKPEEGVTCWSGQSKVLWRRIVWSKVFGVKRDLRLKIGGCTGLRIRG
jgi:hypothetical protein